MLEITLKLIRLSPSQDIRCTGFLRGFQHYGLTINFFHNIFVNNYETNIVQKVIWNMNLMILHA